MARWKWRQEACESACLVMKERSFLKLGGRWGRPLTSTNTDTQRPVFTQYTHPALLFRDFYCKEIEFHTFYLHVFFISSDCLRICLFWMFNTCSPMPEFHLPYLRSGRHPLINLQSDGFVQEEQLLLGTRQEIWNTCYQKWMILMTKLTSDFYYFVLNTFEGGANIP